MKKIVFLLCLVLLIAGCFEPTIHSNATVENINKETGFCKVKVVAPVKGMYADDLVDDIMYSIQSVSEVHPECMEIALAVYADKKDLTDKYGNKLKADLYLGQVSMELDEVRKYADKWAFYSAYRETIKHYAKGKFTRMDLYE